MAYRAISGAALQYQKSDGSLASGFYLQMESSGTSTSINMATDAAAGTLIARAQLDSSGYPTTDGSTRFVPYINETYKLSLFPSLADAQAKTNAEWTHDVLEPIGVTGITENVIFAEDFSTFALAVTAAAGKELLISTNLVVAANITVAGVSLRFIQGGNLDPNSGITITLNCSILGNNLEIFDSTSLGTIAGDFNGADINVRWFGAEADGTTDDSGAIERAIDTAFSSHLGNVGPVGGTAQNSVPTVDFPHGEYLSSAVSIGSDAALSIRGKGVIVGTGSTPTNGFITGTACRNLTVKDLHFENFTTVFAVSSNNADNSMYIFDNVSAGDVTTFIDSNTHATSRSTTCKFNNCKFTADITNLTKVYFDNLSFKNCWFQTATSSADYIFANSNIHIDSCMFVSGGSAANDKSWIKFTNDNGAGGTTSEQNRNVLITNSRFTNDSAGFATGIVCDFPTINATSSTPNITIHNCSIAGNKTTASLYESGNTEGGFIYLKQYPAGINFQSTSFYGNHGDVEAKPVARKDSLTVASAPVQFNIWFDESSYLGIQRTMATNANFNIGTLAPYINNPDPFTYRGILESGYLDVADATAGGVQKATFKVATNTASFNHLPISFFLVLSGMSADTSPNAAYSGTSVYCVTINGFTDGANKARVTSTLIHEDSGGYGSNSSTSIVSLHFGTADTGINTVASATSYDVTVTYGSASDNGIGFGIARIHPLMQFHNRSNGNVG